MAARHTERDADPAPDVVWGLLMSARAFARASHPIVAGLPGGQRGHLVLATVARGLPRSQLALAQLLAIDKTAMTYLLDELEDAGLVQRCTDPEDRRARQVAITTKGKRLLHKLGPQLEAATAELFAELSGDEVATFRGIVERLGWCSQTRPIDPANDNALGSC